MAELVEAFQDITYGLPGVTKDKSDPINRSLYAIGGMTVERGGVSSSRDTESVWTLYSTGNIGGNYFYNLNICIPFARLILPME